MEKECNVFYWFIGDIYNVNNVNVIYVFGFIK